MSRVDLDVLRELQAKAEAMDAAGPDAFRTGQDHLTPAFREINWQHAFTALAEITDPVFDALPSLIEYAERLEEIIALCDGWDAMTKGESPTSKTIRDIALGRERKQ